MILNNDTVPESSAVAWMGLGELQPGSAAVIRGFDWEQADPAFLQRLTEIGFLENVVVQVLHAAPWSQDPISVQVKDAVYAIRRKEANWVRVEAQRAEA